MLLGGAGGSDYNSMEVQPNPAPPGARSIPHGADGFSRLDKLIDALIDLDAMDVRIASDHVAAPNAWVGGIVIGAVAIAALTKFAE